MTVSQVQSDYSNLPGLFIALEGGEGSGKTSLAKEMGERLTAAGHNVLITREPGASNLGAKLRQIWLSPDLAKDDVDGYESLFMFAADRHAHVRQVVLPALEAGRIVITDRYVFSAKAYQASEGVDAEVVNQICSLATYDLLPQQTYWLDVPPSVGLERIAAQNRSEVASKYDLAKLDFHEHVHTAFKALWQAFPDQITRVNGNRPADIVLAEVYGDVQKRVNTWRQAR